MKGSYTVEAALILPFLCLLLCASIGFTLSLYEKVAGFGEEGAEKLRAMKANSEAVRLERLICEWRQE